MTAYNKRQSMKTTVIWLLKMYLFLTFWAACTATVLAAGSDGSVPHGWTTSEPREELRPNFSFDAHGGRDGKGAFIIESDHREGLDGWWTKTIPVKGGTHYHFHAARRIDRVAVPRQSALVRIVWQDDDGRSVPLDGPTVSGYLKGWKLTAEPEFPTDKQTDAAGWTEVSDTYSRLEGDSRRDRASSAMGPARRPDRMERSLARGNLSTRGPQGATGRCSL